MHAQESEPFRDGTSSRGEEQSIQPLGYPTIGLSLRCLEVVTYKKKNLSMLSTGDYLYIKKSSDLKLRRERERPSSPTDD